MTEPPPSITCPRCGRTSYNPGDVREGYCGACHDWTRDPEPVWIPDVGLDPIPPPGEPT